ncbi:Double Clp-N motif-containing P-loop nucleoside triphosphate hydrolases superfamily protein [Rhynchospora pubera]|uniref:Double Clp-N motif-containing P-loop nucleoside triphosphate hydrolases superfamily protein n=1 Tax=Rhynchospora pubera TaxID=906938 RepID=A0AAV8DRP3_9POAL|nr:Double Clp-N motif-containing P-loop nucleoside triphosphate hydrolases superfamily protein [Rhynchospora pubera]
MPTPVTAARACLTPEASTALDAAVATARRRSHAQTTSLHFISSLLSSPLLRDALSRSRSTAYSPRLQFKALELCFSVALDRLPSCSSSSSSSSVSAPLDEPPVSNSLMAAIKRSQANQRRNPDTFHLYQQQTQTCTSSSSFSGVKVELQQLILAILDDPVVSRVFAEAGFRSSDIKLAVLRPAPPPILRFPRRCPPLFLCSFSNGSDELIGSVASTGNEHCRKIGEILSRDSGNGGNPMLIGAGAGDAARDFSGAVNRHNWSLFPPELEGIRIFNVELDHADQIDDIVNRFGDAPGPGVVLSVGDLNDLLEGEKAGRIVLEVSRVLEIKRDRIWVMGWSVNYETYLKFLSKYPLVDKDWELRILPITPSSSRANATTANGCFNKAHSFVPFGGFFPETYQPVGVVNSPYQYQSGTRCSNCNYNYEQEVMTIVKASSVEAVDQVQSNLPSWMSKSNSGAFSNGFGDSAKAMDDNKMVLNGKIANLQKKWTDYCHRVHTSCPPRIVAPENNYALFPSFIPVNQNPAMVTLPRPNRPTQSISLPLSTNLRDEDLISKLQPRHSKSEQLHLHASEGHASPSSATSVTTDLALATPRGLSEKSESPKAQLHSQVNLNADPVTPSRNLNIPDVASYKSFFTDLFKRVGRQEEALKHISAVVCSRATPNSIRNLSKRGIWLGFQGGDQSAQKRVAIALSEMLSGRADNLVSVDLGKSFNVNNHRMTIIDYIAGEIPKMASAVVYIENVDKADIMEQIALSNAVETGKLCDSRRREIGIDGTIFLLSCRREGMLSSTKEYSSFAEENILSAQGRKMKIVVGSPNMVIGSSLNRRVVVTRRCESAKRKSNTCYGSPKRPHIGLDLNLPIEESQGEPENNSSSEDDTDTWVEGLFEKLDRRVEFSAFNYNALAEDVLRNVNKVFCENFGSMSCQLEIEMDAMEQILAVEERRIICEWVETVLGASFGEMKQRCSQVSGTVIFRLVACERDLLREGENLPGSSLLPSKIIIS